MGSGNARELSKNRVTPLALSRESSTVLHATGLHRRGGLSISPVHSTRLVRPDRSTVPCPALAMPMAAATHAVVCTIMIATPMATRVHDGVHAIAHVMCNFRWDRWRWRWWRWRRECKSRAGGQGKAESQQGGAQGERCGGHGKLRKAVSRMRSQWEDRHATVRSVLYTSRAGGAAHHRPRAASATARNNARPLFIVSSHSLAGSESWTIPAPACTCSLPSWITAVRIAIAVSASPCQPR
jgi:hypothetical protein